MEGIIISEDLEDLLKLEGILDTHLDECIDSNCTACLEIAN